MRLGAPSGDDMRAHARERRGALRDRAGARLAAAFATLVLLGPIPGAHGQKPSTGSTAATPRGQARGPVDTARFAEEYAEGRRLGEGDPRVGFGWRDATRVVEPSRLAVRLPSGLHTGPSRLCVDVTSQDGRYVAHAEYVLPSTGEGVVLLAFPTKYEGVLSKLSERKVGVIARLQNHCAGADGVVVPALWHPRNGPEPQGALTALLSSDALSVSLAAVDPSLPRIVCSAPTPTAPVAKYEESVAAITHECRLPSLPRAQQLSYFVQQRNGSTGLRDVPFTIVVP